MPLAEPNAEPKPPSPRALDAVGEIFAAPGAELVPGAVGVVGPDSAAVLRGQTTAR